MEIIMLFSLSAVIVLGLSAASPLTTIEHSTQIDHDTGPLTANYHGNIEIDQKQTGSVTPSGRPSTLRCMWTASIAVTRDAKTADGMILGRQFVRENVASGSYAGWCSKNKIAIAESVAKRTPDLERHMTALVQEDRNILLADLDRLRSSARTM